MTTYIVAEAGSNWIPGDLDSALALVRAAADAGADAVKFQYFRVDEMDRPQEWRERCRPWELPEEWLDRLRQAAVTERWGRMDFILSLFSWNLEAARLCGTLKIASSELGNCDLLTMINEHGYRYSERTGKAWRGKVFLSTGETDYAAHRISLALAWLNRCDVTLMHCVCEYPTPAPAARLGRIEWLADTFGLPTGWSSHVSYPDAVPIAVRAVGAGATVVEAHLKLETTPEECPDAGAWSLLPSEFAELVEAVRAVNE